MTSTVRVLPTWQIIGSLLLALDFGGSITLLVTLLSALPSPTLECPPKGLFTGEEATRALQPKNHKKGHNDPTSIIRSGNEMCHNPDLGMTFEFHVESDFRKPHVGSTANSHTCAS